MAERTAEVVTDDEVRLLVSRGELENDIRGDASPDCRTFDLIAEGCELIDRIDNRIHGLKQSIFEYSRFILHLYKLSV